MGYYTGYSLEIIKGRQDLISQFREECGDAAYAIDDAGEQEEICKWYRHEEDLKKFSAAHDDALFKLSGEGEESGDIWIKYFKGGKVQTCKARIYFDEFNPEFLK